MRYWKREERIGEGWTIGERGLGQGQSAEKLGRMKSTAKREVSGAGGWEHGCHKCNWPYREGGVIDLWSSCI